MEREALMLDALALAMAARNSNGLVIAQVERICAAERARSARRWWCPACWSTASCVAQPEHHRQTYATVYNPAFSGELRVPLDTLAPMPLDERKLIARRCAFELPLGGVVNLGIGVPEVVARVAAEEKVLDYLTLTAEPGVIGGMPQGGLDFGAAVNTDAVMHQNQQFDFYDGGGLDMACLGMAEVDAAGQRQRQPLRPAPRRRRWLHQHQPERAPGRCSPAPSRPAGSRSRIADGKRDASSREGRRGSSSTRSSRSPSTAR